ncbi:MAG: aminotransferase class V-fold PLP-dependent enzyme, partial [Lachnospiraceae bacterium]
MEETIYLDNAATTFPKPEAVYLEMDSVNRNCCVNAGRGSYKLARNANEIIDDVKTRMKQLVKAPSTASVVLSPSITVALNQILNGIDFKQNDIVYVSPYEHNAVARTLKKIMDTDKIIVKLMPTDGQSQEIDINLLRDMIMQDKPKCICCTHVSNVTGYILPI